MPPQLLHCLASLVPLFERVCHRGWKLSVTSPSFSAPGVQLCSQCAQGQQRSWVEHVLGQLQQVVKSESQKRLRFKTTSHKIYFTIYLGFYSPLICVIIFALSGTTSFATPCQLVANSEIHNESMKMVIFLLPLHHFKSPKCPWMVLFFQSSLWWPGSWRPWHCQHWL